MDSSRQPGSWSRPRACLGSLGCLLTNLLSNKRQARPPACGARCHRGRSIRRILLEFRAHRRVCALSLAEATIGRHPAKSKPGDYSNNRRPQSSLRPARLPVLPGGRTLPRVPAHPRSPAQTHQRSHSIPDQQPRADWALLPPLLVSLLLLLLPPLLPFLPQLLLLFRPALQRLHCRPPPHRCWAPREVGRLGLVQLRPQQLSLLLA
jgi:hypothetical protein